MYRHSTNFSDLIGETLTAIEVTDEYYTGDKITFRCESGNVFEMYHNQDCCENVSIESIDGDIQRLVGQRVENAFENSNSMDNESEFESCTWTFYTIRTNLDSVTIRWFGSSNGYYSEEASFYLVSKGDEDNED